MSRRIVMTNTHRQHKIAKASAIATHKRYHLAIAEQHRERANEIERVLDNNDWDVSVGQFDRPTIEFMRQQVIDLRAAAIAEENSKCMDNH